MVFCVCKNDFCEKSVNYNLKYCDFNNFRLTLLFLCVGLVWLQTCYQLRTCKAMVTYSN